MINKKKLVLFTSLSLALLMNNVQPQWTNVATEHADETTRTAHALPDSHAIGSAETIEKENTTEVAIAESNEPIADPEKEPVEEAIAEETPSVEPKMESTPEEPAQSEPIKEKMPDTGSAEEAPTYQPMHIYYGDTAVPYKNGGKASGQNIIDSTSSASTWGGAMTFSGTDGLNTHLIGHRTGPSQFATMHLHSTFIVTDANGNAFRYVKTSGYVVDEYGNNVDTGAYLFDRIAGSEGGERIVLQSTKVHPTKYIVEATFDGQVQ